MKSRESAGRWIGKWLLVVVVVCGVVVAHAPAAPNWDVSEIDGDGIDNDGDGYTDSEDTECGSHYEGYGKVSVGGAGGTVFWVNPNFLDLLDPGMDPGSGTHADPCTLRKALDGSNRVIKFTNGGTYHLNGFISVRGSNITIDGFSAPDPGVTITHSHANHGGIDIAPGEGASTHDFIINHLRFDGLWDEVQDHVVGYRLFAVRAPETTGGVSNMVVDHLTVREDQDKCGFFRRIENVTISNSLFCRSAKGLLITGRDGNRERKNFTVYQNVLAENNERNPQLRDWITNLDFVNNVIYHWAYSDWGYGCRVRNMAGENHVNANIVNNYFYTPGGYQSNALIYGMVPGRDSYDNGPVISLPQGTVYTESDMGDLWVAGNILPASNQDQYSTITGPLPIPSWAQVPTAEATELYQFVPQVGMQYRDTRELGVIDRVMAAIGPEVYGRYVFYNDSAFDGNDSGANASDDGAIAPDKSALLAGGTATFANYTSYAGGINGIMIDIPSLPGAPTAADFTFKVGNDSSPAGWATAAAPISVTVRAGAGMGGADRITIIWGHNAIERQWLQVTVKATANTGLSSPDVFYFGNAIGETGNPASDAEITPTDQVAVRNNPHTLAQNPADIDDVCDFNRDRKVGPADAIICRNNGTSGPTALQLITVP